MTFDRTLRRAFRRLGDNESNDILQTLRALIHLKLAGGPCTIV